jgi:hypothetical protein
LFNGLDTGKRGRNQNGLINRGAHGGNADDLIHRWADDGEVEPFAAPDVAVENLPDMQTEIHIGDRGSFQLPAFIQGDYSIACSYGCGQCGTGGMSPVCRGENRKRAISGDMLSPTQFGLFWVSAAPLAIFFGIIFLSSNDFQRQSVDRERFLCHEVRN